MSVVIGIETENFVIIASDSQATTSSGKVMSAGKLISAREDLTVGLVGTLHWQRWVIDCLSTSAPDEEAMTDIYLATPVGLDPKRANEFRWLLENIPESTGDDESCFAILASPRGLYLVDGAGVVPLMRSTYEGRVSEPIAVSAVGSGADFALGAALTHMTLFSQLGTSVDNAEVLENVVTNALATTYRFDPSCSGVCRLRIFRKDEADAAPAPVRLRVLNREENEDEDEDEDVH